VLQKLKTFTVQHLSRRFVYYSYFVCQHNSAAEHEEFYYSLVLFTFMLVILFSECNWRASINRGFPCHCRTQAFIPLETLSQTLLRDCNQLPALFFSSFSPPSYYFCKCISKILIKLSVYPVFFQYLLSFTLFSCIISYYYILPY
jgi:hypothetical protein